MINKVFFLLLAAVITTSGCKKLIEIDPPVDKVIGDVAFNSNANAISVVTGTYLNIINDAIYFTSAMSQSADEVTLHFVDLQQILTVYTNEMRSEYNYLAWSFGYNNIFRLNGAIEGINASSKLDPEVKQQLLGEAKFTRAFLYFHLANLYGSIPYVTSTDYKHNSTLTRTPAPEVYDLVIKDLLAAAEQLNSEFVNSDAMTPSSERIRPSRWAAYALLARVYLYKKDWKNAEAYASMVIGEDERFALLSDLNSVFLKNSREAIWQMAPFSVNNLNLYTQDARYYYLTSAPNGDSPVSLSDRLYNSFEPDDKRKANWTGVYIDAEVTPAREYPFSYKYKIKTGNEILEYSMVMRLAEQYLIRAEARAQQGILTGTNSAASDLNAIRQRAGLEVTAAETLPQMMTAIETERRHELFTEWGHRWLDLKRWGRADDVMPDVTREKGGSWQTTDQLYPVPLLDLQNNPNLNPQNPGY